MLWGVPLTTWFSLFGAASGLGGISAWYFGFRNARLVEQKNRVQAAAELAAVEAQDRNNFRATLMAEIASLRVLVKECDVDKEILRSRISGAEAQIQVLKAANEIMERWVAFFKARQIDGE